MTDFDEVAPIPSLGIKSRENVLSTFFAKVRVKIISLKVISIYEGNS